MFNHEYFYPVNLVLVQAVTTGMLVRARRGCLRDVERDCCIPPPVNLTVPMHSDTPPHPVDHDTNTGQKCTWPHTEKNKICQ